MTSRVTNSFCQMKIDEEARLQQQKVAKGKQNKNASAD
jgi:hypothetical protein